MALLSLDIEVLENIVNRVDNADKSNLMTTCNKLLQAKLSRVCTSISILPYNLEWMQCNSTDEEAIPDDNFPTGYKKLEAVRNIHDSSIHMLLNDKTIIHDAVLFRYASAKYIVVHGEQLKRALDCMKSLRSIHTHLRAEHIPLLTSMSSSLTKLTICVDKVTVAYDLMSLLPSTILRLKMWCNDGTRIIMHGTYAKLLPPNLEKLSKMYFQHAKGIRKLPRSLTNLVCGVEPDVSVQDLPPSLTKYRNSKIISNICHLSHLPLRDLTCVCSPSTDLSSLSLLMSLTRLNICLDSTDYDWTSGTNFMSIVELPHSLTDLSLHSVSEVCFIVPKLIKFPNVYSRYYNVYTLADKKWTYLGYDYPICTPDNVEIAVLHIDNIRYDNWVIDIFENMKDTVVTLRMSSNYQNDISTIGFKFDHLTKCTRLTLPWTVPLATLPPNIVNMEVQNIRPSGRCMIWPDTLKSVKTRYKIPSYIIATMKIDALECGADMRDLIINLDCLAHIPSVLLHVRTNREEYPKPPANVKYHYY